MGDKTISDAWAANSGPKFLIAAVEYHLNSHLLLGNIAPRILMTDSVHFVLLLLNQETQWIFINFYKINLNICIEVCCFYVSLHYSLGNSASLTVCFRSL